ncbi:Polynucleotidyl transferase, ribonuclease H-like superfamily protein [Thalictrum thalictroides]|uniref:Polynucleotidyl transferase, ribonuclease H-like superfamily protein n=1 Tax=Thalictrum thalictroides TaxID=46969 RepID=A0A7J6VIS2_THATH|nr:Polynucleotidyl transferase, ribonuclease H-like superfamily protein [Thalictrum thalictroides]
MMETDNISISEITCDSPNKRMFTVDFVGKHCTVTVTSTPSVVRRWIRSTWFFHRYLRYKLVVGLGVQWNPSSVEPAGTLQLCVGHRCLIFQLTHSDSVPNLLRRFLNDTRTTFVGIWNHSDERRLMDSDHKLTLSSSPKDLRYSVADRLEDPDLRGASMETLVSRFFGYHGIRKDPDVAMSDWNADCLTEEQVLYAAVDAYVSFQIGSSFRWGKSGSDIGN